ncbi:helix-turn-helix domain-containing protein [Blastococcus sp. Marseille-P5729]|uniref:helix-turn-helix domain-containing protein n=1 Tax=Blastococcus sp. Marseille-P5729 TaxID=2086582 RepID=UPI000D0ECDFB|nr:helix-turn-helix transcriptional regulator [Blastococcus sp. Marseille-P5729]
MTNVVRFERRDAQSHGKRAPEPLWREAAGEVLREERQARGERIVDVADRAGIAPQYLSEVERGRKDPSSEVLSAIAGALGLRTSELVARTANRLGQGPVCLAA